MTDTAGSETCIIGHLVKCRDTNRTEFESYRGYVFQSSEIAEQFIVENLAPESNWRVFVAIQTAMQDRG